MIYLIKFDADGRRQDTYVKEEKTKAQIQELLSQGFLEVQETDYQLLLGNVDGHEYIRNSDGTYSQYVPPEPTEEEKQAIALQQAKYERAEAVSKIIVEVDGMKFDGDEEAQTRIGRTVAGAIALGVDINTYTQTWVLADNTIATPTIKQLATALKLAGEKQTELWIIPYTD